MLNDGAYIDEHEFYELFTRLYPTLVNYASRIVASKQLSEDIVHDVFCHLWDNRWNYGKFESMESYLFRATFNRCIDSSRHKKIVNNFYSNTYRELYFKSVIQTPESEIISKESYNKIWSAINQLPPRCKEIFILKKIHRKSYKEISVLMNITVKTVENQMNIAYNTLKKELGWRGILLLAFFRF